MASERQEQLQEAHDRHESELRALRASAQIGLEGVTTYSGLDRNHVLDMRAEVAVLAGAVRELSDRVDRMSDQGISQAGSGNLRPDMPGELQICTQTEAALAMARARET